MKCPKCGYLGFESVDRCRNCGYDFSLATARDPVELPLRSGDTAVQPSADLPLDGETGHQSGERPLTDLPLFNEPDDGALMTRVSRPRPPLAVRRPTAEATRAHRPRPNAPTLELEPEETDAGAPSASAFQSEESFASAPAERYAPAVSVASLGPRSTAALIDLAVLGAIDAAVLYFTLRILGLSLGDLALVPLGPLGVFLLTLNGGYLLAFNAGGQTIGKMAAGIRVVSMSGDQLDLPRSALRTLMWLFLAAPAGLGFLSVLLSEDGRGLHDRFAGTQVVRLV